MRFVQTSLRFGTVGLLTIIFPLWSQTVGVSSAPAANVNGEVITVQDLDGAVDLEVAPLRERIATIRRMALNRLIDNRLIEQAARLQGVSEAEYLKEQVERVTVTDQDVEDAYRKSSSRFPGQLPTEVKYRIRRTLEDNRRADAFRAVLKTLRKEARVQNLLLEGVTVQLTVADNLRGPTLGRADAPVTVVEFVDFECPYCRALVPAMRKIRSNDQVRLVFKHYPLERHSNAYGAAKAGVCAHQQNRFWKYYEGAFSGEHQLTEAGLASMANLIGLNPVEFKACLTSETTDQEVQRDVDLGRAIGVNGTPTIFVNGRRLDSPASLDGVIAELLSSAANVQRHPAGQNQN